MLYSSRDGFCFGWLYIRVCIRLLKRNVFWGISALAVLGRGHDSVHARRQCEVPSTKGDGFVDGTSFFDRLGVARLCVGEASKQEKAGCFTPGLLYNT